MIEDILHPFQESNNVEALIQYLRNAKEGQMNIAFWIGAGVSKSAGYPLWRELADQLIRIYQTLDSASYERLMKKQIIEELEENGKFERVLEVVKSDDKRFFERNIQKIFKNSEQDPNKDTIIFNVISKFVRYRVSVITTNLDTELENILIEKFGINKEQISIVPEGDGGFSDKRIYYLHGRIDKPNSWVLTEGDYAQAYDNEPRVCGKFLEKFLNRLEVLVVIGYSLSEKEIYRKFLKSGNNPEIFWIQLLDTDEEKKKFEKQLLYLKDILKLNIKIIPYKESRGLVNLLEEIYKRAHESNLKEVVHSYE